MEQWSQRMDIMSYIIIIIINNTTTNNNNNNNVYVEQWSQWMDTIGILPPWFWTTFWLTIDCIWFCD